MTVSVKMLKDIAAQAQAMADAAQALADAAQALARAIQAIADDCAEQLAAKKAATMSAEPTEEVPGDGDAGASAEEAPTKTYTITEVRAFVAERSKPENRAQIKAILKSFGVSKLTELPEAQYEPLMRKVAAL